MSSKDTTYHVAKDLIYELHNPEPKNPLVKLGYVHNKAFNTLTEIFRTEKPQQYLQRVTVKEVGKKKTPRSEPGRNPYEKGTAIKGTNNTEPLRVSIVEAYPDVLQPDPTRSQDLRVIPKF